MLQHALNQALAEVKLMLKWVYQDLTKSEFDSQTLLRVFSASKTKQRI